MAPKELTDESSRRRARAVRETHWRFMERCALHAPLWFCVWNKRGLPEASDEWRDGLMTGMDILAWMHAHPTWFSDGPWDDGRYARPVSLTPAGHEALTQRDRYDMEPHHGGLVEPGYVVVPWPREEPSP